jgi:MipA family protein
MKTALCALSTVAQWLMLALLCGIAAPAHADAVEKPLWEFGLGVGALGFADYRGADTGHVYPVPVPYFIYRGEYLRADRDGVRGLLLNQSWVELNLSVNATTPVRSRDTPARSGMPDLQPTVEIGPSLDFHLWRSEDRRVRLDLRMPVRAAFTVQAAPRFIGEFFAPRLNLDLLDLGNHSGWNVGMLAGPLFASQRYHEYFYGVAPEYATTDRPAYQASAGYAGSESVLSVSKRFTRYWVGAFVRYDSLNRATFDASPLVRSNSYWAAGVGISWMIGQSQRTVEVGDQFQ